MRNKHCLKTAARATFGFEHIASDATAYAWKSPTMAQGFPPKLDRASLTPSSPPSPQMSAPGWDFPSFTESCISTVETSALKINREEERASLSNCLSLLYRPEIMERASLQRPAQNSTSALDESWWSKMSPRLLN